MAEPVAATVLHERFGGALAVVGEVARAEGRERTGTVASHEYFIGINAVLGGVGTKISHGGFSVLHGPVEGAHHFDAIHFCIETQYIGCNAESVADGGHHIAAPCHGLPERRHIGFVARSPGPAVYGDDERAGGFGVVAGFVQVGQQRLKAVVRRQVPVLTEEVGGAPVLAALPVSDIGRHIHASEHRLGVPA